MTAPPPTAAPVAPGARIVDRGYRRYGGARRGRMAAMRAVVGYTSQRVLGLHRKARYKVFPVLTVILAYVPAVVFIGVIVLTKRLGDINAEVINGRLVAQYSGYYGFVISAMMLFAAFVGPEVLCPDRTNGMLGLYLAGPLNRVTYLVSKFAAVSSVLFLVTLGPPLLLLIGYTTQDYGPDGFAGWMATLGRLVASAVMVTTIYAVITMAIASLTTRRAAASATILVVMVGVPVLIESLIRGPAHQSGKLWLLSLFSMPQDLVYRIYGEASPFYVVAHRRHGGFRSGPTLVTPRLSTVELWASYGAWLALGVAIISISYRRLRVTR